MFMVTENESVENEEKKKKRGKVWVEIGEENRGVGNQGKEKRER
jgi:hypothetical protein